MVALVSDDFWLTMLARFRAGIDQGVPLESRSGAGVGRVRTDDGQVAYLKLTPATLGAPALASAQRELRFYQELAPIARVRTPRLLDHAETEAGVALLLAAAGEPRPVTAWTPRRWGDLGRELAGLHGLPLPAPDNDWHRPSALHQAMVEPNLEEIDAFWGPVLPQLSALLSQRDELEQRITGLEPVFTHGDCHAGNIVYSGGSPVFCDWQAARVGTPVSDLAFLSVRATPAGVMVPPDLIDAYLSARPCPRHELERALVAEELAVFVYQWPPFAAFNSPAGNARVHERTRALVRRWFDSREQDHRIS
jgi:aminoglycoside phosphotransferase (APT) family kinase protein